MTTNAWLPVARYGTVMSSRVPWQRWPSARTDGVRSAHAADASSTTASKLVIALMGDSPLFEVKSGLRPPLAFHEAGEGFMQLVARPVAQTFRRLRTHRHLGSDF